MSKLTMKNNGVSLELGLDGEYNLKMKDFSLENCRPLIVCDGKEYQLGEWQKASETSEKIVLKSSNELGKWFLEFESVAGDGISIRLYGKLLAPQADLQLIALELPVLELSHILCQGGKMGGCASHLLNDIEKEDFESEYQLMLTRDGSTLQMAFPLRQRQPGLFKGVAEKGQIKSLRAFCDIHNFSGTEIEAEPVTIKCSTDGIKLMQDYADGSLEKPKDFSGAFPAGWNSWDYYRWTITEEEVIKNAEFIANDPVLSQHVKRIIVDDGWQYCYGEWEANHYFPNGMKYLADKITELGFEPGLWFAPTIVEPHANIAQMGYDMLACSEGGQPCFAYECMGRKGFLLDPTQDKVRDHLQNIFKRYADMGYKYFKLDFMGQTMKAKRFADSMIPRSEIPRLIVKHIHEAVHDKATILGCNYYFKGGTDYVDAVRIGGDIHAKWNSILNNTVAVAARFWSNKRLWVNDPDFALCRAFDTCNDEEINRLQPALIAVDPEDPNPEAGAFKQVDIKRPQSEILLSIALAAGGAINLSDKMYLLNESGLDLARRTVSAPVGETAIPLDLFSSSLPSRWLQKVGNSYRLLLINWSDEECGMTFDLSKYGITASKAVNFWNDKPVNVCGNCIETVLEPRSCMFAVIS